MPKRSTVDSQSQTHKRKLETLACAFVRVCETKRLLKKLVVRQPDHQTGILRSSPDPVGPATETVEA